MPFGMFRESDHPRGKGGQFAPKGGGTPSEKQSSQPTGERPKVLPGREKNQTPPNRGKRDQNEKSRGSAMRKMLKKPSDFPNGKYDWLWAEGAANTEPHNSPAKNAPKTIRKPIESRKTKGVTTTRAKATTPTKPTQNAQSRMAAKQELVKQKHRAAGLELSAEKQKKHPSKMKIARLMNEQKKLGQQANALKAKELESKAKAAQKVAKKAPRNDYKAKLNANSAQQKAIGARIAIEQQKKHKDPFAISRLNRKSARLANQARKINRKGSKEAIRNAKQKVRAAKR